MEIGAGGIRWHVEIRGIEKAPLLALVHGFAGSLRTWDFLAPLLENRFRLLLIDLPGYGRTPLPEKAMPLDDLAFSLGELIAGFEEEAGPVFLCGYSMGGRIALHVALTQTLSGLILIGASPGIADSKERAERRAADEGLAENILHKGSEWFADYWESLPIFESQKRLPKEVRETIHSERLRANPAGLDFALRSWGTGIQADLRPRLRHLQTPVLLLAGETDKKFCAINSDMASMLSAGKATQIPNAGHAAHLENPEAVAAAIFKFTESLSKSAARTR